MVIHYPTKFDGHKICDSGDMILLVAEGQDFTCSHLILSLLFISKAHGMLCSHTQNSTIKKTLIKSFATLSSEKAPSWSHASWIMNDKTLAKKVLPARF